MRGTVQQNVFPKEPFEDCVMHNYRIKRDLASNDKRRKSKKAGGQSKNFIVINGFSDCMQKYQGEIIGLKNFFGKRIEVSERLFENLETSDSISLDLLNQEIRKDIVDFEKYFQFSTDLKARCYDENDNILYFDLEGIACFVVD